MSALVQMECERLGYNPKPNVPLEVVGYWAERGVQVDPYGPPLVNGLPHGLDRVSFRKGRASSGAIHHQLISLPKRILEIHALPLIPETIVRAKPKSRRALVLWPLDLQGAEKYISENLDSVDSSLLLNQVIRLVGHFHGYSVDDLKGVRRFKRLSMARQQAYWHMYNGTDASYPKVGRFMGGRDHTAILLGCRAHERRLAKIAKELGYA